MTLKAPQKLEPDDDDDDGGEEEAQQRPSPGIGDVSRDAASSLGSQIFFFFGFFTWRGHGIGSYDETSMGKCNTCTVFASTQHVRGVQRQNYTRTQKYEAHATCECVLTNRS